MQVTLRFTWRALPFTSAETRSSTCTRGVRAGIQARGSLLGVTMPS